MVARLYEASGIVLDDIDMHDAEAVADDDTLDRLASLDSEGFLVHMRNDTTDFKQAFFIHQAILVEAKGLEYAGNFTLNYPNFMNHPSFTSAMLDAYSNKDYGAILSWRPCLSPTLPRNAQRGAIKIAMAKQYSVPYKGQVATLFAEFVQIHALKARHDIKLYANVIPVIQSSGTGKSRMLTETGKTLFTLPFCAREEGAIGWPPADNNIRDYLMRSPDSQFSMETHIIFIAFLAAIFAEMEDVLKSFGTQDIDTLRQKWHTYMEPALGSSTIPTRDRFYANVLKRTKDYKFEIGSQNSKLPQLLPYSEDEEDANLRRMFFAQLADHVNRLSLEFLRTKVIALLTVIPNKVLLVYIDEAQTFCERYWAFQRVLWTLKEHGMLWFSFMGTNPALSELVPAAADLKSLRLADETLVLLPPYTALGFDQNIIDLSPHQTVTMGQVSSLDWICTFGRPLWKASCTGGGDETEAAFFRDAKIKLLCSTEFVKSYHQVFAILSYTVCLDLVLGNQKAAQLAETSVAKHMRLLIEVNDNRTICFTQASSEPVLALVGASIAAKPKNLRPIIDQLTSKLCGNGLVDKGRHGELLARMILFLARIQTCPPRCLTPRSTPLLFATPVPVVHFLKTLFGELWNKTPGHERFEKDLEGGYVNFYHFTLTRDAMPVKEDLNFEANLWTRGTALQSRFKQTDIDGHIPLYWGPINDDAVLDPSNFSSLDYQMKFQEPGEALSADKIQRPPSDRSSVKRLSHPFIALFLDMGCKDNYTSTNSRLWLETGAETLQRFNSLNMTELPPPRQENVKKAIEELELDPNRYCINARGCDERVFGVLKTMLVDVTEVTSKAQGQIVETMQPLHHLDLASGCCKWIKDYSVSHN
ncbi:hypothetical protein M378DRAFT_166310 [Amanita muscaria Koide BX008]|uniref:Uncharacterized protein n=1 Tax=Amanita muscaria (strain Koide BX008) TaxID=946122 RepID=A0A0C2T5Y9_AMAMK|nr:hypothetical protein M378DRAFT_166310 [Amanita muscaria Koide BX008]